MTPRLVTFNGSSFDLPVLRLSRDGLRRRRAGAGAAAYFYRYSEDAIDLCDVLSSFSLQNKASLHELWAPWEAGRPQRR